MKKEYEKPTLEVVEFEYNVQAEGSSIVDYNVGSWSNWWQL